MQLKKLFKDDDAVSPVIGVILMVAITVILAAVIASFVLGLGSTADEVQPNTNFALDNVDEEGPGDEPIVTMTLTDGDSIDEDEIVFRGDAVADGEQSLDDLPSDNAVSNEVWNTGESLSLTNEGDDDLSGDDGTINVVWEESGGDNSATLASFDIEY